jgi:hypothetical protein
MTCACVQKLMKAAFPALNLKVALGGDRRATGSGVATTKKIFGGNLSWLHELMLVPSALVVDVRRAFDDFVARFVNGVQKQGGKIQSVNKIPWSQLADNVMEQLSCERPGTTAPYRPTDKEWNVGWRLQMVAPASEEEWKLYRLLSPPRFHGKKSTTGSFRVVDNDRHGDATVTPLARSVRSVSGDSESLALFSRTPGTGTTGSTSSATPIASASLTNSRDFLSASGSVTIRRTRERRDSESPADRRSGETAHSASGTATPVSPAPFSSRASGRAASLVSAAADSDSEAYKRTTSGPSDSDAAFDTIVRMLEGLDHVVRKEVMARLVQKHHSEST